MSTALTVEPLDHIDRPPEADHDLEIVRCDASDDAEWNRFVDACPRASFYHRAEWRDINQRSFGHRTVHLAARQHGRIVGVFPIVQVKSLLFGNIGCSMPFVNMGGPCGETDAIEQRLLQEAATVADDWGLDYLEIRSMRPLGDQYRSSQHKVSMTVDLQSDPEILFNAFKREHRKTIRSAQRQGFVARFGPELIDDFYEVLSDAWRERGTPIFRVDYLKAVQQAFPGSLQLCVVYAADGRPAAGAFSGCHAGVVEGMWLGIRSEYRRQLVGYVLYWEIIKRACEEGYRVFHLGRSSKDSGGEQFKKKWNASTLQLHWHYVLRTRATIPDLNPSSPKYQLAMKIWRRLPSTVTQVVGPWISRSIP